MRSASRPVRTTLLAAICSALILALSACEFPTLADQSEGTSSNLATQEQPLSGSEGEQASSAGNPNAPDIPTLMCPGGEEAEDDRATFQVEYNFTLSPPRGPQITLKQTFVYTASYTSEEDPVSEQTIGTLHFENLGQQTAIFKIKWPECMKDAKTEISTNIEFKPTITATCAGGVITLNYSEKWPTKQIMIPCVKGSEICGDSDDCKPVPYYITYGLGPASSLEREFTLDKSFNVHPPNEPVPFVGAAQNGGRIITLQWLP